MREGKVVAPKAFGKVHQPIGPWYEYMQFKFNQLKFFCESHDNQF